MSLFYFVTFGGLVAFANYIPKLMVDLYHLTKTTSGSGAALFVIMATEFGHPHLSEKTCVGGSQTPP